MKARLTILALLIAAASVPAFDYAIGRVSPADRDGRFAMYQAMRDGTSTAPYRYRVLVPWAMSPIVRAAETLWPPAVAFHRVNMAFSFTALVMLLWAVVRYLSNWFPTDTSLVGALLVAATLPIMLRQHVYAPYSLLEPIFFLLAFDALFRCRITLAAVLAVLASINRETGTLLAVAIAIDAWRRQRSLVPALVVGVLGVVSFVGLRVWLGDAIALTVPEIWAMNTDTEAILASLTNALLVAGITGWALAIVGWRHAPAFVRQQWWLPVLYLPLIGVFGVWYEVRLLMPLYPWLLPAIIAAVLPVKE